MIANFTIKHFRGIGSLTMNGLKGLNVLIGKNNCGKTSILEALWFASSTRQPDAGLRINAGRGLDWFTPDHIWTIFHRKDIKQRPEIVVQSENHGAFAVQVRLFFATEQNLSAMPVTLSTIDAETKANGIEIHAGPAPDKLSFTFRLVKTYDEQTKGETLVAHRSQADVVFWSPSIQLILAEVRALLGASFVNSSFGRIVSENREHEVVEALKIFIPTIKEIKLGGTDGNTVLVNEGGALNLPMPLQGDGVVRAFTLATSIVNLSGGVVLVDEIDNGIHTSVLKPFWKTLVTAALRNKTQIFATTHSWESLQCLKAALDEDPEAQNHAAVFNLVRRAEDKISVYPYHYPEFKDA